MAAGQWQEGAKKKRGGIGAYSAKHCHSLNGAFLSNGLICKFLD